MTREEIRTGIARFLAEDGGPEIDGGWFMRSGETGREVLFEMLEQRRISPKRLRTVQCLLVWFFHDEGVEQRLWENARAEQDPDVRATGEFLLGTILKNRATGREMMLKISRPMSASPTVPAAPNLPPASISPASDPAQIEFDLSDGTAP